MERQYWDREKKELYIEDAPAEQQLRFLYTTKLGRILLKTIFARKWFSALCGIYNRSFLSKKKLMAVAKGKNDAEKEIVLAYKNFNDYFIREEFRLSQWEEGVLVSPADGLLSIYKIDENLKVPIKNRNYSIVDLIENDQAARSFKNGTCLVTRLTLGDYHRYSFIDYGTIEEREKIIGSLNTVRPIEGSHENYFKNSREVTYLKSQSFGSIIQIEVGAMLVGKIVNYKDEGEVIPMEEKGYFEYGGSTVILLFREKSLALDEDLEEIFAKGFEIRVKLGERLGEKR